MGNTLGELTFGEFITVAYVHENEIILLKRESGADGSAIVVEYILDCRAKRCLGKRNIATLMP